MNRVAFLDLKSSTEPQQLLVLLAEKPDRSAADNNCWRPWLAWEQVNDRAAQARLAAAKRSNPARRSVKEERKARAHRLIQQGCCSIWRGFGNPGQLGSELLGLEVPAAAKTEDPCNAGRLGTGR